MGADASWTIVAPTARSAVMLDLEMRAFGAARPLAVRLDGGDPQTVQVARDAGRYRIGPLALRAGSHVLTFHSETPATRATDVIGNGDRRSLAFSVGDWKWTDE
jgi:hypothetical protein